MRNIKLKLITVKTLYSLKLMFPLIQIRIVIIIIIQAIIIKMNKMSTKIIHQKIINKKFIKILMILNKR